jgi:hypothetical protein
MNKKGISALLWVLPLLMAPAIALADVDLPSLFSNKGTIGNTRHNLTQRAANGSESPDGRQMDAYRNDYVEICVYCHTPHGANTTIDAPLWNRTIKAQNYQTYNELGTSTLTPDSVSDMPGAASLTCLSCHDGQVGVDSIINMPGPGKYNKDQETNFDKTWLQNQWPDNPRGPGPSASGHYTLTECMTCHATGAPGGGLLATDFDSFLIGTDLKNDHPVGVTFPTTNPDFNQPAATKGTSKYFDNNTNGKMEPAEVRTYNSKVECASCHDPHGVPVGTTPGIQGERTSTVSFNKTFLRVQNDNSALCMTCHIK